MGRYKNTLTGREIRKHFTYDAEQGALFWIKPRGNKGPDNRAGTATKDGKRIIMVDGTFYPEASMIYTLEKGIWPYKGLYHVNFDKSDSRIGNLAHGKNEADARREACLLANPDLMELVEDADPLSPLEAWLLAP